MLLCTYTRTHTDTYIHTSQFDYNLKTQPMRAYTRLCIWLYRIAFDLHSWYVFVIVVLLFLFIYLNIYVFSSLCFSFFVFCLFCFSLACRFSQVKQFTKMFVWNLIFNFVWLFLSFYSSFALNRLHSLRWLWLPKPNNSFCYTQFNFILIQICILRYLV